MSFDERALLREQELWIEPPPRRSRHLDGPIWWLGPIALFAALGAALPRPQPPAPPRAPALEAAEEPAPCPSDVVASASRSISKN